VHRQIEALSLLYPHHRLALLTFNQELALYGDGTHAPSHRFPPWHASAYSTILRLSVSTGPSDSLTVAGDHLEEMDKLVAKGKEFGNAKCALPAKEARSALIKKVALHPRRRHDRVDTQSEVITLHRCTRCKRVAVLRSDQLLPLRLA
jgi:hypothetical protein